MRTTFTALAVLAAASPAAASGGISCATDSGPMELAIQGGVTHGMGSPLFAFQATAGTSDKRVPPDFQRVEFAQPNVAQYWLDGQDLRLVLYREREGGTDHAEVTVVLRLLAGEEGAYEGEYRASIIDVAAGDEPVELAGPITCFVE